MRFGTFFSTLALAAFSAVTAQAEVVALDKGGYTSTTIAKTPLRFATSTR